MSNFISKSNFFFALVFLTISSIKGQNILISQGGTVNVSGGEMFYDAGGAAGNDGNVSYTITLLPAISGQGICVDFTSFSSYETLEIFDGSSVAANNIGTLQGNYGAAYNAAGAPFNTGQALTGAIGAELKPGIFCSNNINGALTFRFTNINGSQSTGWEGNVITYVKNNVGCNVSITANPTTVCSGDAVTLTAVGAVGSSALNNDFNSGTIGSGWNSTPGGVAFVSALTCEPNYLHSTINDGSLYAWMQNVPAPRVLESNGFDVSNGGVISFDFREASDDNGGNGCEALDNREGVCVQYSVDNGVTWVNMKLMFPSIETVFPSAGNIGCGTYVYDWNTTTVPIPVSAFSANTKFRWYQDRSTSGTQDSWGVDNVKIIKNNTNTLTITDLSTGIVVASSTTTSVSVTVNPTSTRTYRATITDGVTSCTNDIIVTVNGGSPTTINYGGSPYLPNAGSSNVTVTNGPVSGVYTASPAGLTIDSTTGAVTPSSSTPGTYTVSVPTTCGTATATVEILSSAFATCATASCPVISITETTAALGQTNISTALATAGDQLGNAPLVPGDNITICVPVTVVAGSSLLGFKQLSSSSPGGCGNPAEEVITYQLTNSSCGAVIPPSRSNASSVSSGFNPEWDGLAPGSYILCFTLNVTSGAICSSVDLQGLGYYNVIPAAVPCQDYQIQMYSDDLLINPITKTNFTCSDASVFLGPDTFLSIFDSGLPYNSVNINIVANTGNLNNLVVYRYNSANVLVETLTVPPGGVSNNYFLRPTGCYYSLDKTNLASGNYSYTITDNTSGTVLASGTWIITAGAESLKTGLLFFQGTGVYSGTGVTNGFDPAPAGSAGDDYTDDRGIGVFNPQAAGVGSHTITYTWDNGLPAPNNCTLTRTMNVTVTGPSAPTISNISICSGQTATLTASGVSGTVNWYATSSGGSSIYTGNPFVTPSLTSATSYWVSQTVGSCESARTQVDISISAATPATYTTTLVNCEPGSITLSSILPSGTTFNWVSGPSGYTFPAGYQTPLTTNTTLTGLPAGNYCVDVASPNSLGGIITQTLFTETFESGLGNWTIDNSNGPNIFVLNNDYVGGSCVTGLGTFNVPAVPNQPAIITSSPNSNYLHIKATTTSGVTCGPGSVNFIPNNANFDGQVSDQKAILNTVFNTVGKTNVRFNFYWLAQGETNANGADDFGSIEYSLNGGATWIQAGAKLRRQTTWLSDFRTDPSWDNQANLRFRIRWQNDASSSIDPPISIDEVVITADVTSVASCGTTTQECFTILATPAVPTITTSAATCSAAGSSTITNYNAANTYVFTPAGPTVGATGLISGMTVGTSYTVTSGNGSCTSVASTSFSNAAQLTTPPVPTITTSSATCSAAGSSTITNYNAANTYVFTPAGPTVGATGLISGMTVGTSYTVTSGNGSCTSVASTSFSNAAQLTTPPVPTITTSAATCSAAGSSTITNYNAANTYVFTPAGPTVGATGLISGMTVGTSYTVISGNGSCSSVASTSFSNAAQLTTPPVPTITTSAATCSAAGSSTITNYNAANTYVFTPAGPTVGATGLISGMTVGTSYTVISGNGSCTSVASTSFSNAAQLTTPPVPTITTSAATCSAAGSSTITNYNAANTYVFTPAGPTVGATGLISGMTVGTSYTVTSGNGSCTSVASTSFSNAAQLTTPPVPTITTSAATCSAAGSSTITNYNAANTYVFTPAGPTVGATGLISGMTVGTSYTVTSGNGSCTSVASASFSNAAQLPTTIPLFTQVSPICSGGSLSVLPTTSNNGITGTWSPALNNTTTTTYTFTPNSGSGVCVSNAQMTITITPRPTVIITNNLPSICSGSSTDIVLTSNVPGATFSWNAVGTNVSGSTNGTGTSINQILTTTSDLVGEVVYTVIATANGCSGDPIEVRVNINPIPDVVVTPTSETICSGTSTNISFSGSISGTVFNWTVVQSGVTGATSGTGTSIQQTLVTTSLISSGTATYTITPVLNGCSGTPVDVIVTVNPTPEILGTPTHLPICSGEFTNINVSAMDPATVFDYTVSAVGVIGATGGTITAGAPIAQQLETISNSQGYVDYTITPTLNGCSGTPIVIRVYVNPLPLPVLEDGVICVELSTGNVFQTYYFHTGLSNSTHTFVWYYEGVIIPGATSTSYEATAAGSYSVIATNIATGCSSLEVFGTVNATNPATSFTYTVTNAFTDNATIVVNVPDGNGTIMYQIDDEALQSSNIFTGVSPGMHVITVVDTQGCTYLTEEVMVIDYPKYFTPNGDGYNDYWNIIGLQNQPGAKLYIFDRYGKLIKQISTTGQGWDGTFNGQQLPSTDYWFTVEFEEAGQQKVFRAHFSLIR